MFLWRTDKNYPSVIFKYPPYLFFWRVCLGLFRDFCVWQASFVFLRKLPKEEKIKEYKEKLAYQKKENEATSLWYNSLYKFSIANMVTHTF